MADSGKKALAGLFIAVFAFSSLPFLLDSVYEYVVVNDSPLIGDKLVLTYYYPWFYNGTNYSGSLGGEIVEPGNASHWGRWGSPENPNYNYTVASSLNQSQVYYWKNSGERNYSWASIAQWPIDGLYDVADPDQINRHFDRMNYAGIDVMIGDFFGDYEWEKPTMDNFIAVAQNRTAEGKTSPKITFMLGTSFADDFEPWGPDELNKTGAKDGPVEWWEFIYHYIKSYLDAHGDKDEFFRVNGKPVFFTWATYRAGYENWTRALSELRKTHDFYIVVDWGYQKPGPPEPHWVELFDGFVHYNPVGYLYNDAPVSNSPNKYENLFWLDFANDPTDANGGVAPEITRHSLVNSPTLNQIFKNMQRYYASFDKFWAPTIIPGYDDRQIYPHENSFVGRKHTTNYGSRLTYCGMWEDALDCDPSWVMICSYNEIHEGTEIDLTVEYGDLFIELTRIYSTAFKAGTVPDRNAIQRLESMTDYTLLNETGFLY
ncbi:MAG: hypothetical protein ACFFCS_10445 [Candidatus Hodarchaeota archaeon]